MTTIYIILIALIGVGIVFITPKRWVNTKLRADLGELILCIAFFAAVFYVLGIHVTFN